jgi:hypothetical protein
MFKNNNYKIGLNIITNRFHGISNKIELNFFNISYPSHKYIFYYAETCYWWQSWFRHQNNWKPVWLIDRLSPKFSWSMPFFNNSVGRAPTLGNSKLVLITYLKKLFLQIQLKLPGLGFGCLGGSVPWQTQQSQTSEKDYIYNVLSGDKH